MTQSGKVRLSPKMIRIMIFAWIGIVVLVAICTFLGILWAYNRSTQEEGTVAEAEAQGVPAQSQGGFPTPTALIPGGQSAGGEPSDAAAPAEPTIPPRQDPSFGYGIQAQIHMNTDQTLDQIQQLGLGWVKQQIRWADLEPVAGEPNWPALDAIFTAAGERNIRVMVSIVDAPDWARSVTAEGKAGPPDDYQNYVNYVSQLVQRYSGVVGAVEVWNEQNLDREWYTAGGLSAANYVEMLALTSDAIHQADPGVIVISGALSPTGFDDGVGAIDDFRYMQQMIDAGLLNHVDCVGAHANGYNLPPNQSAEDALTAGPPPGTQFLGPFDTGNPLNPHHSWSFYSTLTGYHDKIVAAGYDTPLCVTEFGWASVEGMGGAPKQSFEFALDNSLQDQADNIVAAYQLMHDWGFVKLAFLFNLDFSPKSGGNPQDDSALFSITDGNGAPRPAFDAVKNMPKTP